MISVKKLMGFWTNLLWQREGPHDEKRQIQLFKTNKTERHLAIVIANIRRTW